MPDVKTIRLTETVKAGGCASKLSPAVLDKVLGKLPRQNDPNVLVGFDHADDAGVYQITTDQALVQTVDFFTPIVDDPYTFGQIAATNALSDVYAMGGRPLTSLALVCFPEKADLEILEQILAGGLSKMIEAECTVVGGHSIRDDETKFGYSVTGVVHPGKILANKGAQPGDALIFTKSLGTGVISTAIKKGKAESAWIDGAVRSMTTLNRKAAECIVSNDLPVHAMTDVTGFGLIGHAREMALASEVSLAIYADKLPLLPGALECVRAGYIPGGLKNNRDFAECLVEYDEGVSDERRALIFDPQTAGGLLISLGSSETNWVSRFNDEGIPAVQIGEVLPMGKPRIHVKH
jgi:selenide, water dikinase